MAFVKWDLEHEPAIANRMSSRWGAAYDPKNVGHWFKGIHGNAFFVADREKGYILTWIGKPVAFVRSNYDLDQYAAVEMGIVNHAPKPNRVPDYFEPQGVATFWDHTNLSSQIVVEVVPGVRVMASVGRNEARTAKQGNKIAWRRVRELVRKAYRATIRPAPDLISQAMENQP